MAFPQPESEINIDKPTTAGNVKLVLLDGSGRAALRLAADPLDVVFCTGLTVLTLIGPRRA
jgi:hypothetical protein